MASKQLSILISFLLTALPASAQDHNKAWIASISNDERQKTESTGPVTGNFCILVPQSAAASSNANLIPLKFNSSHATAPVSESKQLKATIMWSDTDQKISEHFDELIDAARGRDPRSEKLDRAVTHFRKSTQRAVASSKDAVNFLIPYRAFGPSSEAADIVLDEKLKLKSKASAEFARQQQVDEIHLNLAKATMQIAMGLGDNNQEHGRQTLADGVDKLNQLVGSEAAEKTVALMTGWKSKLKVPESAFEQPTWDVTQQDTKTKMVVAGAMDKDPVIVGIKNALHKYNHMSKARQAMGHVVETALGAAALAPNFIGSGAQIGLMVFEMATGGPEDTKILKELYLNKRIESRFNTLNEETHLALSNYQMALFTKNPVLLAYSQYWVQQLCGDGTTREVFTPQGLVALESAPLPMPMPETKAN